MYKRQTMNLATLCIVLNLWSNFKYHQMFTCKVYANLRLNRACAKSGSDQRCHLKYWGHVTPRTYTKFFKKICSGGHQNGTFSGHNCLISVCTITFQTALRSEGRGFEHRISRYYFKYSTQWTRTLYCKKLSYVDRSFGKEIEESTQMAAWTTFSSVPDTTWWRSRQY